MFKTYGKIWTYVFDQTLKHYDSMLIYSVMIFNMVVFVDNGSPAGTRLSTIH